MPFYSSPKALKYVNSTFFKHFTREILFIRDPLCFYHHWNKSSKCCFYAPDAARDIQVTRFRALIPGLCREMCTCYQMKLCWIRSLWGWYLLVTETASVLPRSQLDSRRPWTMTSHDVINHYKEPRLNKECQVICLTTTCLISMR